jgi:hypothetical protein
MLRPRKYSLGAMVDTIWIGATVAAIWGSVFVVIGGIYFGIRGH